MEYASSSSSSSSRVIVITYDLANRKTTKETNESKSNWRSLRGKSHPNEESQHVLVE